MAHVFRRLVVVPVPEMVVKVTSLGDLGPLWDQHGQALRDPAQIIAQWGGAGSLDKRSLQMRAGGNWWGVLEQLGITLFLTREYEHFVLALSANCHGPRRSLLPLPHPSGLVADRRRKRLIVAATRNPSQLYELKPATKALKRHDRPVGDFRDRPLVPTRCAFYPGSLYLHDLALMGGDILANTVGHNAVSVLAWDGSFERRWWPRSIERRGKPDFARNILHVNGIAAGTTLERSYFTASSARVGRYRPGDADYPVDGAGVIFSGATREPCCTGLTRPHSPRLRRGRVWVNNSGYGEVGIMRDGRLEVVRKMPGWTRGLAFCENVVFVATSRVLPRYTQYAPGLDIDKSLCGVHALCVESGAILGSLLFPWGNQVFALDWMPSTVTRGFPIEATSRRDPDREIALYYAYEC